MTDSDSELHTDSEPAPSPLDCLRNIGKYELEILSGDKHTEGGFCRVYRSQYRTQSSNKQAAIKVSLHAVEDCEHDCKARQLLSLVAVADSQAFTHCCLGMQWIAYKKEWQMYQILAFGRSQAGQSSGIPAIYECEPNTRFGKDCHTVCLKQLSSQAQTFE